METADVIVAGGGSAGFAAALAAARAGARTLLIERQAKLGGMGTNALVHTFCGLFHPDVAQGPRWLNPGIPTEIGQKMLERTGQSAPDLMGKVFVLRQHPAVFAILADELCRAEPNLTVLSGADWTHLERGSPDGWRLEITTRGENRQLHCTALIDTTGDAAGARMYAPNLCEITESAQLYRPAYVCQMSQVSGDHSEAWRLNILGMQVRAIKEGKLPATLLGAAMRDSPFTGEVFLTIDLEAGQSDWNPFDPAKRALVESEGRRAALALWEFLRANHPDFHSCPPPMFPAEAGVRESARYRGDYVLTGDDLAASRQFEDTVALAGWPMEKRENARGPKFRFFNQPEPAGIPARCLKNSSVTGLFFAGRCLSADHEALASVRVMGTCMATGQAAGKMAAEFAARG